VPRVYIETYGCQMNVADTELMVGVLAARGYVRTDSPEEADVILVNTCAVRDNAEQRVIGRMGDLPRDHPVAARALALLTPQAVRPFFEPIGMRVFYSMDVPRTYIRCLQDLAVPPQKAAEYAARLGVTPTDMDCAHDAMLSAPDELARILDRIQ